MPFRFRLLPTLIFCAAFTLALKLGVIWRDAGNLLAVTPAVAKESAGTKAAAPVSTAPKPDQANVPDNSSDRSDSGADKKDAASGVPDNKAATRTGWFDPALVTDSELQVLQKLADRRAEIDKRQHAVETRERLLQATEKRIDSKLAELKTMQQTIDGLLKKHDKQKDERLKSLVKIYENMKPRDAARIFDELDMGILLDILERMREQKAAPILAAMSPDKAKAVTAALARRRELPKPTASASP